MFPNSRKCRSGLKTFGSGNVDGFAKPYLPLQKYHSMLMWFEIAKK